MEPMNGRAARGAILVTIKSRASAVTTITAPSVLFLVANAIQLPKTRHDEPFEALSPLLARVILSSSKLITS